MKDETVEKLDAHRKICVGREFDFHKTEVFNTKQAVTIASYVCRTCSEEFTEKADVTAKAVAA